eukprot:CAMPEP_0184695380 /NCGR_PEP_ID=MMETSP0313-20130426/3024_1 /TAXON_ID=2792 /ORGANISM="Porphyridium aerugineum, Strain SAG 1380-2" /LENGTH=530 /DNA_ID=CAMNT_0027153817 /DNA_START=401 /DNA_END=1993 /DNA_ORIENTATION=+
MAFRSQFEASVQQSLKQKEAEAQKANSSLIREGTENQEDLSKKLNAFEEKDAAAKAGPNLKELKAQRLKQLEIEKQKKAEEAKTKAVEDANRAEQEARRATEDAKRAADDLLYAPAAKVTPPVKTTPDHTGADQAHTQVSMRQPDFTEQKYASRAVPETAVPHGLGVEGVTADVAGLESTDADSLFAQGEVEPGVITKPEPVVADGRSGFVQDVGMVERGIPVQKPAAIMKYYNLSIPAKNARPKRFASSATGLKGYVMKTAVLVSVQGFDGKLRSVLINEHKAKITDVTWAPASISSPVETFVSASEDGQVLLNVIFVDRRQDGVRGLSVVAKKELYPKSETGDYIKKLQIAGSTTSGRVMMVPNSSKEIRSFHYNLDITPGKAPPTPIGPSAPSFHEPGHNQYSTTDEAPAYGRGVSAGSPEYNAQPKWMGARAAKSIGGPPPPVPDPVPSNVSPARRSSFTPDVAKGGVVEESGEMNKKRSFWEQGTAAEKIPQPPALTQDYDKDEKEDAESPADGVPAAPPFPIST